MDRLNELLEKRKNLTANIFEEEELIALSKTLPKEELDKIDPKLLTLSSAERLESIFSKLDEINKLLDKNKT